MNSLKLQIAHLKETQDAMIMAHYYQAPEVQDVADFLGDSLALAQAVQQCRHRVIVLCGVRFMAETAKILNPDRIILIPDMQAGCSLADSVELDELQQWIREHPGSKVVTYINSTTQVKALSDVIVTSANARRIIESFPPDAKLLFTPDYYLGSYLNRVTGRQMMLWHGSCKVHEMFSESAVRELQKRFPAAEVLAHPECPTALLNLAHFVGSTTAIIRYAVESKLREFIIVTEPGVIHQLKRRAPQKEFYPVSNTSGDPLNLCQDMRLTTLDKIVNCLTSLSPQIEMDEELRIRALKPLKRMLELS
ncbi:MAG: quinolinate synthase NadA [Candidatus Delongbacteria bacterium]|nr:quinolinate synthase NadA [Candidatus Delongbacteria bacterium]